MIAEKVKRRIDSPPKSGESPFISVVFPTHTKYPDFRKDEQKLSEMLKKVEAFLDLEYIDDVARRMKNKINTLAENIDFNFHPRSEGLGIFVSPYSEKIVHFPFPVKEKIQITDHFENRDILLAESYRVNYCVLTLNEKHIRLLKCKGMEMREVKDNNFPSVFIDEFEESKPSRGDSWDNTLRGMKKDKSVIKEERFTDFLILIDKKLSNYLEPGTKLIISGLVKNISDFEGVSKHKEKIIGKIEGNYDYSGSKKFSELIWEQVRNYIEDENKKILNRFKEAEGAGNAVYGIENVWKAVQEGKGLILLLEKDFSQPAFLGNDKYRIFLEPPVTKHRIITDAVDEIIDMMLQKKGSIVFTDNNKLRDYAKIGLLLRYK